MPKKHEIEEKTHERELLKDKFQKKKNRKRWFLRVFFACLVIVLIALTVNNALFGMQNLGVHLIIAVTGAAILVQYYDKLSNRMVRYFSIIIGCIYAVFTLIFVLIVLSTNPPLYISLSLPIPLLLVIIVATALDEHLGGKIILWGMTTFVVLLSGIVLILSSIDPVLPIVYPSLMIEMIGALIGLFGAIALGEFLKSLESNSQAKHLYQSILSEISEAETQLCTTDIKKPIDTTVWITVQNEGLVLDLDWETRKKIQDIYKMILHYNDQYRRHHEEVKGKVLQAIDNLGYH